MSPLRALPRREPLLALSEALEPALFRSWLLDHTEEATVGHHFAVFEDPLMNYLRFATGLETLCLLRDGQLHPHPNEPAIPTPSWVGDWRQASDGYTRGGPMDREAALEALDRALTRS